MESRKISKEKKENVKIPLTMMPSHNILNDVNSHLTLGIGNNKKTRIFSTEFAFQNGSEEEREIFKIFTHKVFLLICVKSINGIYA